jgi:hypothetical protein
MNASFTPTDVTGNVLTLAVAGAACGFVSPWFNWQQTYEVLPNPNPISACGRVPGLCLYAKSNPSQPLAIPPTFFDPPAQGGYTYESYYDNANPFYLTSSELIAASTASSLSFLDTPTDPVLDPRLQSKYSFTPTATADAFATSLVGVLPTGLPSMPLSGWTWQSTFNGTSGGLRTSKNLGSIDPGSGTGGGASITSINGVQLPTAVSPGQVATTASGLAYSRVTQTFNGTVTLTNISSSAISGPLQIVFFGMPVNVTLVNATSNLSGTPYMTVPAVASLAPGQSATVSVQFKNPSNVTINSTPVIYSGSIN